MFEGVLVGIVLAAAGCLAPSSVKWVWRVLLGGAGLTIGVVAGLWWGAPAPDELARLRPEDRAPADADYASSRECRACHPAAYASWFGSYHRTMTQPASPASVLHMVQERTHGQRDAPGHRRTRGLTLGRVGLRRDGLTLA